jgi:PAS domain S-box-containing protein
MTLADPAILHDPERVQKLRMLEMLSTAEHPAFDRLTRLAARILKAPVSMVTLIDANRHFIRSSIGLGEPWATRREMPMEYSYCQHTVASAAPVVIADARLDARTSDSPSVVELNAIAYAGMPLITTDGYALGALCVVDTLPRTWTGDELEILHELSLSAVTEIELQSELLERRRAESSLRESQRFIESIVTTIPDIVYVYDLTTRRNVYANREIVETLGYPIAELQSVETLAHIIHPDDLPHIGGQHALLRTIGDDRVVETEYRVRHTDGSYRLLHSRDRAFEREADGSVRCIMGIAQDITERRASEDKVQRLLERLHSIRRVEAELSETLNLDMVLTVAMDTAQRITGAEHGYIALVEDGMLHVVYNAGAFERGTRFPVDQGIVGRAYRNQAGERVLDVAQDPDYVRIIDGMRAQISVPLIYRDRLLGVMTLETARPERFTAEAFEFLLLIIGRITMAIDNAQIYNLSQKQLQDLHTLYQRVSDLEQIKTDIIRIAAHDLRNPLSIVLGYSELMLEISPHLDEAEREHLDSIHRAGRKMEKIIDDILSLERVAASASPGQGAPFDLVALLTAAQPEYAAAAARKKQALSMTIEVDQLVVRGEGAHIREAIDNLVGNAIKYTPEGGNVWITLARDGDQAVFHVQDSGYGIPEAMQDKLFRPFFRAKTVETRDIEGTGLGLHLVRNIVDRHEGTMIVHSVYQQGSTFGFTLPIRA